MVILNERAKELVSQQNRAELTDALREGREYRSFEKRKEDLKQKQRDLMVTPTLNIYLGGSGREIMLRINHQLKRIGIVSFCESILIDTDDSAQSGNGIYEGASESQFVHCSCSRLATVVENHHKEPMLEDRFDLKDDATRQAIAGIARESGDQAGALKARGSLALLCNQDRVIESIRRAIANLTGIYSRLKQFGNDGQQPKIQKRVNVFIYSSSAGGTGSSMVVDIAAKVASLTEGMLVQITPVILMPSVFENALSGYPEQIDRAMSNGYGTLRDLDAFNLGFGETQRVKLGTNDRNASQFPTGLFSTTFIVERVLADGTDLRTTSAVYDMVALHSVAWIGTSMSDRIACEDANLATLRKLTIDPDTRKLRNWSSMGATALSFPAERIGKLCAAKQSFHFLRGALGSNDSDANGFVNGWLSTCLHGKSLLKPSDDLTAHLASKVRIDLAKYIHPLFKRVDANRRRYRSYANFRHRVDDAVSKIADVQGQSFSQQLEKLGTEVSVVLVSSLLQRADDLGMNNGLNSSIQYLKVLHHRLKTDITKLESEVNEDRRRSDTAKASIYNHKPSFLARCFTRCSAHQDAIASAMKDAISGESRWRTKERAIVVLSSLADAAQKREMELTHSRARVVQQAQQLKLQIAEYSHGNRVCAELNVELDISTSDLENKLFAKLRMDEVRLHELVSSHPNNRGGIHPRKLLLLPGGFVVIEQSVRAEFQERLAGIKITDVIHNMLSDPIAWNESRACEAPSLETLGDLEDRHRAWLRHGHEPLSNRLQLRSPVSRFDWLDKRTPSARRS